MKTFFKNIVIAFILLFSLPAIAQAQSDTTAANGIEDENYMDTAVTTDTAAVDLDKVLDDYQVVLKKFAPVYKKVQTGDINAQSELQNFVQELSSLSNILSNHSAMLTTAQTLRLKDMMENFQKEAGLLNATKENKSKSSSQLKKTTKKPVVKTAPAKKPASSQKKPAPKK